MRLPVARREGGAQGVLARLPGRGEVVPAGQGQRAQGGQPGLGPGVGAAEGDADAVDGEVELLVAGVVAGTTAGTVPQAASSTVSGRTPAARAGRSTRRP